MPINCIVKRCKAGGSFSIISYIFTAYNAQFLDPFCLIYNMLIDRIIFKYFFIFVRYPHSCHEKNPLVNPRIIYTLENNNAELGFDFKAISACVHVAKVLVGCSDPRNIGMRHVFTS